MKSLYKIALGVSALSMLFFAGCKKFRDVNKNPNNPDQVTIQLLLPSAQAEIAQSLGGKFQIAGGIWSQYWTQDPSASQYRGFEQYVVDASEFNNQWNGLYAGALTDLEQIIKLGGTQKNYIAIAKILKGYTFQLLTDEFGDVPFSEALQGESQGLTSPHYDNQEAVYNGLISLLKEGVSELDDDAAHPAGDDLIYGGDLDSWRKFGNTVLLRVYLRLAYRSPAVAEAGITELYANGIGFIEEGGTAQIVYSSEPGNYNPMYSEINNAVINRQLNIIASSTAIDSFLANNDARIAAFYFPNGTFKGLKQGNFRSPGATYSTPSAAVGGDVRAASVAQSAVAPVIFLSDYESLFLQAEAAVRGWGTGNDQELFERGVTANFQAYGGPINDAIDVVFASQIADSVAIDAVNGHAVDIKFSLNYAITTYLHGDGSILNEGDYYLEGDPVSVTPASFWGTYPSAGSTEEKLKFIITQKWFSMCGNQSVESWNEWRRTGYPNFFNVSVESEITPGAFPVRFPYPEGEQSNNLNFPGQKQITDKVWWDAN